MNFKKHIDICFLILLSLTFLSFVSCQVKSREELIIGKWKMNKEEYKEAQMLLEFYKNKSSIIDRIVKGQSTFKQNYKYSLVDKGQFLLLEPTDSLQKLWKVEIIELDDKILKLRSKSLDSSFLVLERQKE